MRSLSDGLLKTLLSLMAGAAPGKIGMCVGNLTTNITSV